MKTAQIIISICCIFAAITQIIAAISISYGYLFAAFVAVLGAVVAWPEQKNDVRHKAPFTDERIFNNTKTQYY